jgi:hypothetical protein
MQTSAPDDGRKHRPKHEKLTWNKKLVYIVHHVDYFQSLVLSFCRHRQRQGLYLRDAVCSASLNLKLYIII